MTMLRKILYVVVLVLLICTAVVFAYHNPEPIDLDIGLARFEQISLTLALAGAFAFGWIFGLLTLGTALIRLIAERRRLRRQLQAAETEVSSLRTMPIENAD